MAGIYEILSDFGDTIQAKRKEAARTQAFSGGLPMKPDGTPDYGAMASTLLKLGDQQGALTAARLADSQAESASTRAYRDATLGISRGQLDIQRQQLQMRAPETATVYGPGGQPQTAQFQGGQWQPIGGEKAPPPMAAADKKAILESEDALLPLRNTLGVLDRAIALNPKTFDGVGASTGAWIGTSGLPGTGYIADPERAKASREQQDLLTVEGVKAMTDMLKGATTEQEMSRILDAIANPSTPKDVRLRYLTRLRNLAQGQYDLQARRVQDMRGGGYFKPAADLSQASAGQPMSPSPQPGMPQIGETVRGWRYRGGPPGDKSSWEPAQ